jgi:hypothetical protein
MWSFRAEKTSSCSHNTRFGMAMQGILTPCPVTSYSSPHTSTATIRYLYTHVTLTDFTLKKLTLNVLSRRSVATCMHLGGRGRGKDLYCLGLIQIFGAAARSWHCQSSQRSKDPNIPSYTIFFLRTYGTVRDFDAIPTTSWLSHSVILRLRTNC